MNAKRIDEILTELQEISARISEKYVTMVMRPIDGPWSCELYFSKEELNLTHDLTDELDYLMDFRMAFNMFPYRAK